MRSVRVKTLAVGACIFAGALASPAGAEPPPTVDVVVPDAPRAARSLVVEWNPLPLLFIGKVSANVVWAPVDHHAIVLSPFFASVNTVPIYVYDDAGNATRLPEQRFRGFGAELGYRYYFGRGGPRGVFVGPSLLLGSFDVTAEVGGKTRYLDYGIAGDVGFETLIADDFAIALGAGLQYTAPSKSIPDQQFPANVYANSLVRPRAILSLGWAF